MDWLLIVIVSGFLFASSDGTPCPTEDWTLNDDICYISPSQKMSWIDAVDFCCFVTAMNEFPNLVAIDSQEKQDDVALFKDSLNRNSSNYWIGGTDATIEGVWRWLPDMSTFTGEYSNWGSNYPRTDSEKNCLSLKNDDATWKDNNCNQLQFAICELFVDQRK